MSFTLPLPQANQPLPPHARKVFAGVLFDVYQWEQELFDGSVATFEKLWRRDSACVIPVMPDQSILLTRQEQPGMQPFMSFLGGMVDDGETAEQAAHRELAEEAGLQVKELRLLYASNPQSKIQSVNHVFVAHGCEVVGETHLEPGEKIELMRVSWDELVELCKQPVFRNLDFSYAVLLALSLPGQIEELRSAIFEPTA